MKTIKDYGMAEKIQLVIKSTFGEGSEDYAEMLTPKFTDQSQADLLNEATFKITSEHETRNGVSWVATLTFNGQTFSVDNYGDGGAHHYSSGTAGALQMLEDFADEVFGDLDTMIDALDIICSIKVAS